MPDMMVLARCVGAETQLQRVTAGWWNQLIENIDSTVLELWSDQWSLHQRCFHIDVSSLSRLVVWRCLADSVLASSSAGRCDVRATRRHCSTYLLYCTVFRFCTLVHFRCCWFEKVPVLHVCLVIMAGNCFWCILEEMFLVFRGVYNGRLCGRSFSWTSSEVVAVRRVGVFVLVDLRKLNLCVWGGHI